MEKTGREWLKIAAVFRVVRLHMIFLAFSYPRVLSYYSVMNMESAYNLKFSKINACVDSTLLRGYGPPLLTSKHPPNSRPCFAPPRVPSWHATVLTLVLLSSPKNSKVFNPLVTSLSSSHWTFWPQLIWPAPAPSAWNFFLLGRPTTSWSFILHLLLFPLLRSKWWSCHPTFSLYPSSHLQITFWWCLHSLTSAALCVYNSLNSLLHTILSSDWSISKYVAHQSVHRILNVYLTNCQI